MSVIRWSRENPQQQCQYGVCASNRSRRITALFRKISDDLDKSFAAVKEAMKKVDFLITTGGVSVGDFDFLPAIYENSERTCSLIKLPCARAA